MAFDAILSRRSFLKVVVVLILVYAILFYLSSEAFSLFSLEIPAIPGQWYNLPCVDEKDFMPKSISTTNSSLFSMSPKVPAKKTYPHLNVVGLPKAGTSNLYKILSSHRSAVALDKQKELCASAFQSDTEYIAYVSERMQSAGDAITVNGCLHPEQPIDFFSEALESQSKFIVVLRDPADLLWAAYNFWVLPMDNETGRVIKKGQWVDWVDPDDPRFHRSPEHFHEFVDTWNWPDGRYAGTWTNDLVDKFGREKVLFVSNSEMSDNGRWFEFVTKLSTFTGLDISGFDITSLVGRTNCGDAKGSEKACDAKEPGLYKVSGYKSIMPETRAKVYKQWAETCRSWKELGVDFEECARGDQP